MMTDMTLAALTADVRETVGADCGLGSRLKFDFKGGGVIWIDATVIPNIVSNDDKDADCTLVMSMSDFVEMSANRLDATIAFMTGRLKVIGDMAIAMKIDGVLR